MSTSDETRALPRDARALLDPYRRGFGSNVLPKRFGAGRFTRRYKSVAAPKCTGCTRHAVRADCDKHRP
jgi:hypothetical protein